MPSENILRERLERDIFLAVTDCIRLAENHPNVGLFISETDLDVLCVRNPGREGEALFDYLVYDWRELLEDGHPSEDAIRRLAQKLTPGDLLSL